MDDITTCYISSSNAKITFYKRGNDRPNVIASSAYRDNNLYIRIDDNKAIRMGSNAPDRQAALDVLLPQIQTGKRIRTQFSDYPSSQEGDGLICNLPQLLESC